MIIDAYRFAPTVLGYSATVLSMNPVLYWKLDETTGTSYADASGNGYTGTGSGTITQNQSPVFSGGSSASALFGGGVIGNTTNAFFTSGGVTGDFSLGCEFNLTSLAADNYILGRGLTDANWGAALRVTTAGALQILVTYTSPSTGTSVVGTANGAIVTGTSYMVHATSASSNTGAPLILYVNGASVASGTLSGKFVRGGPSPDPGFYVGQGINNTTQCSGRVDEVAAYNGILSAAQIAAQYAVRNTA